jgi:hypothetical protein
MRDIFRSFSYKKTFKPSIYPFSFMYMRVSGEGIVFHTSLTPLLLA